MKVQALTSVVAALALAACNSVSATLDNDPTDSIKSSFFIEKDGFYGADGIVQVYLVTFSDACTSYEAYWDELNEMNWWGNWDVLDDLEDLWAENFPETFEETVISIRVDDPDDSVAGLDFKGVDYNDGLTDDDETKATLTRYKQWLDEDYWEGVFFTGGDTDDYVEAWNTDDGDMSIGGHRPTETIRGTFTTELVEPDDGDLESSATFRFNASHCEELEDEIY